MEGLKETPGASTFDKTNKANDTSIKNQRNFASKAYDFIKSKMPTNLKVLLKENPKRFGLFVLTCIATSAAVIILAAVSITAFVTGNYGLAVAAGLGAAGIGFAGYKLGRHLLKSDIDLKEKSSTRINLEYNECIKENKQFNENIDGLKLLLDPEKEKRFSILEKLKPVEKEYKEKLQNMRLRNNADRKMSDTEKTELKELKSKYKDLKNQKSLVEDSLGNIRSEISEQQQKIQYNKSKMKRMETAVEKYSAEYSKDVLKNKSDKKIAKVDVEISVDEEND